jgi:hypothetical protein
MVMPSCRVGASAPFLGVTMLKKADTKRMKEYLQGKQPMKAYRKAQELGGGYQAIEMQKKKKK